MGWLARAGHAVCLLWSSREGEKARWSWAGIFSFHSPLIKGGFLEEKEEGVKRQRRGRRARGKGQVEENL